MYNEYFGLKEPPFSIAPDPRYLYMSKEHREALAHLVYGFNSDGGFVLLTGEVGTGKTTVCRCLLEQTHDNTSIAYILNPKLTVPELLATVCDELGIKYPKDNSSIKVFVDLINVCLLETHATGRKTVLLIDEAQNLSSEVLEQLRLLTNLETNQRKLLQIILIGQPELRDKLSKPDLRQLSQRIIARYHLGVLSRKDVGSYVSHRLSVAGLQDQLFPGATINKLYRLSGGVPRLINVLCDRALLGTYTLNKKFVNTSTLKKAAREVFGELKSRRPGQYRKAAAWVFSSLIIIAVGVVLAATYYKEKSHYKEKSQVTTGYEKVGIPYQPANNVPACDQAEAGGLKCYESLGSLNRLRNINRPAVLKLSDSEGNQYYAALTAMKGDSAKIIVGAETREVSLKDVESFWPGEYILLWRPPADSKDVIKPGVQGPVVQWLDKQLTLFEGGPNLPRENLQYDDELVKRVKIFQLAKGLVPDGKAGTQTMIHLDAADSSDKPSLVEMQKDR
ncbi:MAG: AAA family ATPase [Nitrospirae bacterium]|nr:AAA family ATPase [Nitrospirota bacterium]